MRRFNLSIDVSSLHICFLAGTLGRGGAERQLIFMLRALQNEGIKPRVLCLTKGESLEEEILDLGISVDWVGASQNNFARLNKIIRNLRQAPVHIVQCAHFYTNIYAAAAGRVLKVPSIGAIRGNLTSEIAANGVYGKWQLSWPRSQIANSMFALERAVAFGYPKEKLFLVHNAVATTDGLKSRRNTSKTSLLFAGRLVELKRPELFIELAYQLRKLTPNHDLDFVIAGDGPLRSRLERLAKDKGLQNGEIKFLGEQSAMTEVYQNSDVLISTSAHEGTPNVVLEAMACGMPVVATNVGGVPEILGTDRGVLIDRADPEGMAERVRTLILDRDLRCRMGTRARDYVMKNHSLEYLQKTLMGVYSQILSRK